MKTKFIILILTLILTATVMMPSAVAEENETTNYTGTPAESNEDSVEKPGFEAIFAIAGLLAVAYLVRRD